jgi:hypothetical protein
LTPITPQPSSPAKGSILRTCDACHKTAAKMLVCSRCHLAFYCRRECQILKWNVHKKVCQPEPTRREDVKTIRQASTQLLNTPNISLNPDYIFKARELEKLDAELLDLIKDHP